MGLNTKILNVQQEIRWKVFAMEKDMNVANKIKITLAYEEGYYNEKDQWVCTNNQAIYVEGDAAKVFAAGITPQNLGKSSTHPLGLILDTALYGILSGQIPTTTELGIEATSSASGSPLTGTFQVFDSKGDQVLFGELGKTYTTSVLISPTITIHSPGFVSITLNPAVLQGPVLLTPQLAPVPPVEE